MPGNLVASIDVGTSRVKLRIYDVDEGFAQIYGETVNAPLIRRGYVAEQDPIKLRDIVFHMLRVAAERGVKAVGFSVYRASVVAWEKNGTPLTGIVTWMDRRSLAVYERLPLYLKLVSKLPVIGTVFSPGSPLLMMRHFLHQPLVGEAVRRGDAYLWTLDALIAYWVTGRFTADPSNAALTGLLDPRTLKPFPLIPRLAGLRKLELPEIALHDQVIGSWEGVSIGPIIADQQAASVGLKCLEEGCMKISLGTGMFLDYATGPKPLLGAGEGLVPLLLLYTSTTRIYGVEGFLAGPGILIDSLVSSFFESYEDLARHAAMEEDAALLVPSVAGLRVPYKPFMEGALLGITPKPSKPMLARGAVAGIALAATDIYYRLASAVGEPHTVRVGGGLSRLGPLIQLMCRWIGRPLEVSINPDDSARGSAMLAALASGLLEGLDDVQVSLKTVEPEHKGEPGIPEVVEAWRELIDVLGSKSFWKKLRRTLVAASLRKPLSLD